MIQERYGHNEMCYPSQSFGLTKIYMKGAFGKPCTSCKWGATHTLFAVHIIWVLATVRQVFDETASTSYTCRTGGAFRSKKTYLAHLLLGILNRVTLIKLLLGIPIC